MRLALILLAVTVIGAATATACGSILVGAHRLDGTVELQLMVALYG